jgi:hypothetical protein
MNSATQPVGSALRKKGHPFENDRRRAGEGPLANGGGHLSDATGNVYAASSDLCERKSRRRAE